MVIVVLDEPGGVGLAGGLNACRRVRPSEALGRKISTLPALT